MAHTYGARSLLIDDAAVLLGVSRRTVYYRIRDGRLATVRTRGGSQRVLLWSIERLLREERGLPALQYPPPEPGRASDAEPTPLEVQPLP